MSPTKLNIRIDLVIGVAFLLVLLSGLAASAGRRASEFHTFVSLGLSVGIVTHLVLHHKWIAAALRPSKKAGQIIINIWLNGLLGLTFVLTLISGLHGHLDPSSGAPTHTLAAASMTGILLIHLARHWKWVMTTARRYWD